MSFALLLLPCYLDLHRYVLLDRHGEQSWRIDFEVGEPIRAVYEWAAQFKQLFDPYGHAWLVAEPPRTAARPALLGDRPHRRK